MQRARWVERCQQEARHKCAPLSARVARERLCTLWGGLCCRRSATLGLPCPPGSVRVARDNKACARDQRSVGSTHSAPCSDTRSTISTRRSQRSSLSCRAIVATEPTLQPPPLASIRQAHGHRPPQAQRCPAPTGPAFGAVQSSPASLSRPWSGLDRLPARSHRIPIPPEGFALGPRGVAAAL